MKQIDNVTGGDVIRTCETVTGCIREETVSSETVYRGKILTLMKDTVRLPNGNISAREYIRHGGAVAIIPLMPDGRVLMEYQYRYAQGRTVFEIPAGKLDSPDERPEDAAARELKEETGAVAGRLTPIGSLVPSVAILTEKIYLYLAEDLTFGDTQPDEDEFLRLEPIPLDTLVGMVTEGTITDAKTQIAVLKTHLLLKSRNDAVQSTGKEETNHE